LTEAWAAFTNTSGGIDRIGGAVAGDAGTSRVLSAKNMAIVLGMTVS
jgi:hypothetical protein